MEFLIDVKTSPVDKGCAWIIVGASFVTHLIGLGILYSLGVYLTPLEEEFDISRATSSFNNGLVYMVMLSGGLVSGKATKRHGARNVLLLSALIVGCAQIGASFCDDMWQVMICSVVLGFGLSCTYIPVISAVQTWFIEKRGLATGLSVAGSGLGNFIGPLILQALIDSHDWRVAMRWEGIICAFFLVVCGFFTVLHPPPQDDERQPQQHEQNDNDPVVNDIATSLELRTIKCNEDEKDAKDVKVPEAGNLSAENQEIAIGDDIKVSLSVAADLNTHESISPFATPIRSTTDEELKSKDESTPLNLTSTDTNADTVSSALSKSLAQRASSASTVSSFAADTSTNLPISPNSFDPSPLGRSVSFDPLLGSGNNNDGDDNKELANIAEELRDPTNRNGDSREDKIDDKSSDLDDADIPPPPVFRRQTSVWKKIRPVRNTSVFRWLMIGNFFGSFGYGNPFFHLVAFGTEEGISKSEAALILSCVGLASLVGRVIGGLLADKYGKLRLLLISTLIMSVFSFFWSLCTTTELLMTYALVYGFNAGAYISLPPAVATDYFGVHVISQLIGYLFGINCIGAIVGPTLCGYFFDETDSYLGASLLTGFALFLAFASWYQLPSTDDFHSYHLGYDIRTTSAEAKDNNSLDSNEKESDQSGREEAEEDASEKPLGKSDNDNVGLNLKLSIAKEKDLIINKDLSASVQVDQIS